MRGSGLPAVRPGRGEWTDDPAAAALECDMTRTLAAQPVETRLQPLYATGFIHGFALWYSIKKLFMRSIGLNDYLITIATLVCIVVMMIANIPLGILADRWSRKGALCLATCAFLTLHRFREPGLHHTAPGARLSAHLGQILRAATKADVTWIIVCLVANGIGTWPAVRRARCCGTRRERPCPWVPLGGESRC
jgi:hypothetical protein